MRAAPGGENLNLRFKRSPGPAYFMLCSQIVDSVGDCSVYNFQAVMFYFTG